MTREEFNKIKEAEKDHLRKLKKLKQAARQLERQKSVSRAVTDMTSSVRNTLDRHADAMDMISTEAALNEARLEFALENTDVSSEKLSELADEETLSKSRAQDFVRQMKGAHETPDAQTSPDGDALDEEAHDSEPDHDELPEKTIGRMKP